MRVVLISLLALLAGCSVVDRLGNKPYPFPVAEDAFAEVVVHYDKGASFAIYNMDENGCFAGTSALGPSGSVVKIHAEKEAYIALEKRIANSFCQVIFSFIPERNVKYTFTQKNFVQKKVGGLGFFNSSAAYCGVGGEKILESGEKKSLKLKQMLLRPSGLACLRMREKT